MGSGLFIVDVMEATTLHEMNLILTENSPDFAIISTQYEDGSIFSLFPLKPMQCPMIITSKTEQEAYQAIRLHADGYLLEPVAEVDLFNTLNYVLTLRTTATNGRGESSSRTYKQRLLVKIGDKLKSLGAGDVAYAYAEGKVVYIIALSSNKKYIIDYSLDELEKSILNPASFFRINRKFIINIDAIDEVRSYMNSRLKLTLSVSSDADMIVSREKVVAFKNWMNY